MAKAKRNIGQEILDGLRELKRGEHGRVINVPDVASIRGKTGLSSYAGDPFFRGMTPIEKALAAEWLMRKRDAEAVLTVRA